MKKEIPEGSRKTRTTHQTNFEFGDPKPEARKKVAMRTCKVCKTRFERTYDNVVWCSVDCGVELAKQRLEKEKDKKWKEKQKKWNAELRKKSYYEGKLQDEINWIVRLLDHECFCMSCTKPYNEHAGHYHSRGSNTTLQFNLLNIWGQCAECNTHKSANIIGYDEGLLAMFGREVWEMIKFGLVREYPLLNLSKEMLIEATEVAREIRKELSKAKIRYTNEDRLLKRIEINGKLSIYKTG